MSNSETMTIYNTLASKSHSEPELLGCALPTLYGGRIEAQHQVCNRDELKLILAQWQDAEGWYQSRADVGLGMPVNLDELLEGQWHRADQSLHLALRSDQTYSLTLFIQHEVSQDQLARQCYSDQLIFLRPSLKSQNQTLRYRIWWQQAETGPNEGSWRPLLQQFLGLAQQKEQ